MRVETPQAAVQSVAPKKKRRLGFRASVRLFFALIIIIVLGAGVVAFLTIPKRFNILIIGSDQRAEERGRSDVLMLVSLTKSPRDPISILTIPRDTRVDVPGFGMQKVTHAYALGQKDDSTAILGNRSLTKETVESFLGITIDATVELTFKSFEDIINRLGGITVGRYGHLDGEAALAKVRNRSREGGDFARTDDQRLILTEVVNEVRRQNALQSTYGFLRASSESRITLSQGRFAPFAVYALLRRGGNLNLKDVHNDVIPGKGQLIYTSDFAKDLYYWVPDSDKTSMLIKTWFS